MIVLPIVCLWLCEDTGYFSLLLIVIILFAGNYSSYYMNPLPQNASRLLIASNVTSTESLEKEKQQALLNKQRYDQDLILNR